MNGAALERVRDIAGLEAGLVKAYIDEINYYEREYPEEYTEIGYRALTYDLIYLDEDDIPELALGQAGYWVSVSTYDSGKLYTIMDEWGYGVGGVPGYRYIPQKNVVYGEDADRAGLDLYEFYGRVNRNYEIESYYEESLEIHYDDESGKDRYYYGDKEITKEEHDSYRIEGDSEEIAGSVRASPILAYLEAVKLPA